MFDLTNLPAPNFGPSGETVYTRTYSRTKADGSKETWAETVERVVVGNLCLAYGDPSLWTDEIRREADDLFRAIYNFEIIPAGRHLWATGVPGRAFLFNCHVAGWGETLAEHFEFTFLRLMEGGGVGANYASRILSRYGAPTQRLNLHIVSDPGHRDFEAMFDADVLSPEYSDDWLGAYEIEDSREGWAAALVDLIDTFFRDDVRHENRVYDVSNVRPKGSRLKTFGGTASGPLPLAQMLHTVAEVLNRAHDQGRITPLDAMDIDHAIGACVVAGGVRRSARMSIVPWDDPYILDFISAKSDPSKHWTTNISVEVDDAFFDALDREMGTDPKAEAQALRVHRAVVAGMLRNGEPGYWNSSLSNVGEVGYVEATNPCGEIALEAWENCNLGHVNLEAFADGGDIFKAHRLMTRFLIRATFGDVTDAKQAARLAANRRIGVGHFGVQGYLVRRGVRYSDAPLNSGFRSLLRQLRRLVREVAREYAFDLRIPEPVKVTTVAPTGTIAKLPGATEGIHPVYARYFIRRIRFSLLRDEEVFQVAEMEADGYDVEPDLHADNTVVVSIPTKDRLVKAAEDLGLPADIVEDASEIPLGTMLAFQQMYQEDYADNAVSFTVNVPEGTYSVTEVATALAVALPHLKGTTLMPDGTRPQAPYERLTAEQYEALSAPIIPIAVDDSYDAACASGSCPIR